MSKLDTIFKENYIYGTDQGNLGHGLNVYFIDIFGRYTITPIKKNGSSGFYYAVDTLYTYRYESALLTFKSKKKAMQHVVAQLFTELFDYELHRIT